MSLINLGPPLSRAGDGAAAVEALREAVDHGRNAPALPPYRTDLAVALNSLGNLLAETGDGEGAVRAATESVGILRELAAGDPGVRLPLLALSLHNLGRRLSESGRGPEALRAVDEAVLIYRGLPERFAEDLAEAERTRARIVARVGGRP
jgi:tetratricopeptide (TPR) repeat protein